MSAARWGSRPSAASCSAREDGEVYLRGNVFQIERGASSSSTPIRRRCRRSTCWRRRAAPATTSRCGSTAASTTSASILTSDPPLAQPDLMSLITTGSTSNSMSPGSATARNAQDALVAADLERHPRAGRQVGRSRQRAGRRTRSRSDGRRRRPADAADDRQVDRQLARPAAVAEPARERLHVGGDRPPARQRGRPLRVARLARPTRSRSPTRSSSASRGGRAPAPAKRRAERPTLTVASVTVSGGGLPEREVLDVTKTRTGEAFEFFEWQRDRERIEAPVPLARLPAGAGVGHARTGAGGDERRRPSLPGPAGARHQAPVTGSRTARTGRARG